jgi:hypothetical protein
MGSRRDPRDEDARLLASGPGGDGDRRPSSRTGCRWVGSHGSGQGARQAGRARGRQVYGDRAAAPPAGRNQRDGGLSDGGRSRAGLRRPSSESGANHRAPDGDRCGHAARRRRRDPRGAQEPHPRCNVHDAVRRSRPTSDHDDSEDTFTKALPAIVLPCGAQLRWRPFEWRDRSTSSGGPRGGWITDCEAAHRRCEGGCYDRGSDDNDELTGQGLACIERCGQSWTRCGK